MNHPTLNILVGLPGSGKSTWTKAQREKNANIMAVNKDSLRSMFGAGVYFYDHRVEDAIRNAVVTCTIKLLVDGFDVIIDETNLTKAHRALWLGVAKSTMKIVHPKIVWFKENTNNLENRMKDPRGVSREKWESVIEEMKKIFEPPTTDECSDIIEVTSV